MSEYGCGPNCHYKHMEEIWKETEFSNKHLVSNHGRVKNKATGRILSTDKGYPYVVVGFCQGTLYVQRLVAKAFLTQVNEKAWLVNHINGIKQDNHVWNLEYVTSAGNLKHGYETGLIKKKWKRPVLQIDKKSGEILAEYASLTAASEQTGFHFANISNACLKKTQAFDYLWKYKDADLQEKEYRDSETSGEEWKQLPGKKNIEISNTGRARNTSRRYIYKLSKSGQGYIRLASYGLLHTFVAQLFIPNDDPLHKTQVNHIDENKSNNHVSNLQWCSPSENVRHSIGRRVLQLSLDGRLIQAYDSVKQAAVAAKRSEKSMIACLKGKRRKTCADCVWKYADE